MRIHARSYCIASQRNLEIYLRDFWLYNERQWGPKQHWTQLTLIESIFFCVPLKFHIRKKRHTGVERRAVAVTAISQYRAFESITAEECNNRSNRDISFFFFFVRLRPSRFILGAYVLNISNDNNVYHADL